jgi:hypothetical protein
MSKKRTTSSSGNLFNYFDSKRACSTSTTSQISNPESDSAGDFSERLVETVELKKETTSCSATAEQNAAVPSIQKAAHPNDIGHFIHGTVPLTNAKRYKF